MIGSRNADVPRPAIAVRLRMSISPWTDASFVRAVEEASKRVRLCEDVELSSVAGAEMAETILRDSGFSRARVIDCRSYDEALRHIAHWQVNRDGRET